LGLTNVLDPAVGLSAVGLSGNKIHGETENATIDDWFACSAFGSAIEEFPRPNRRGDDWTEPFRKSPAEREGMGDIIAAIDAVCAITSVKVGYSLARKLTVRGYMHMNSILNFESLSRKSSIKSVSLTV